MNAVAFTGHFDACVGHAGGNQSETHRGVTIKYREEFGKWDYMFTLFGRTYTKGGFSDVQACSRYARELVDDLK